MKITSASRARGGSRGGCGGGYERTNPDYDSDKLKRLRAEYDELAPEWRATFLQGLSKFEQAIVTNRHMEIR